MSFKLIDLKSAQTMWVPVTGTAELYAGQIVEWSGEGVDIIDVASGAWDATGETAIAGLVISTNNKNKVFHGGGTVSGFAGEQITGVATQANMVREAFGHGGMYNKHEKMALVEIALLDSTTRLRGSIFNAAYGTAPSLLTATAVDTDGLTETTNACNFTPVADLATIYCRKGANAGLYRVTDDTSTTVATHDHAWPKDCAVDDKFVRVNMKQGLSRAYIDAYGLYFDVSAALTTNYYGIHVDYLNLRVAGNEYCEFRFVNKHFGGSIA